MVLYSNCDEEHPYYAQSCCDSGHGPQCDAVVPGLYTRCMAGKDHPQDYHVSYLRDKNIWWA